MPKYVSIDDLPLSDHVKALNPQLAQKPKEQKTDARKRLEAEIRQNFAKQFEAIWQRLGGPELSKEVKISDEREFKNDYVHIPTKVIIEVDGGVYNGGRHVRAKGFINDCVKLNMATMAGYSIIRIPTGFATENYLQPIIDFIRTKEAK